MYIYDKRTNKLLLDEKILSDDETIKYINEYIDILQKQLINANNLLDATKILKKIHLLQANIAVIELGEIFGDRLAQIVSKQIKTQVFQGITSKGNRFGLKYLFLKSNNLSEAQQKESLRKYSESGIISYYKIIENAKLSSGFKFARRFLNGTNNCPDCVEYSDRGLQFIGSLPVPTENCLCYTNCKCSIEYYE